MKGKGLTPTPPRPLIEPYRASSKELVSEKRVEMIKIGAFIIIPAKKLQSLETEHVKLQQKYKTLYSNYIGTLNRPLGVREHSR